MSDRAAVCTSSGVPLSESGATTFNCPKCGEISIGRSPRCRNQAVLYQCKDCGFEGP